MKGRTRPSWIRRGSGAWPRVRDRPRETSRNCSSSSIWLAACSRSSGEAGSLGGECWARYDMKMDIMEICGEVISEYALCDSCLGRQFASLDRTFGNKEKGRALKMMLHMQAQMHASTKRKDAFRSLKALAESGYEPCLATLRKMRRKLDIVTRPCYICSGFMDRLEEFSLKAINSLGDVECSTIMIGCKMPLQVEESEDELKARYKLRHGENIRYEVTREIGKRIQALADKRMDKLRPDITLIVRLPEGDVEVNINPVFFKGRYR
ncbi:hypothetical protein FDZ71_08560, partial [bacterium]